MCFQECDQLTDAFAEHLARCKQLESVDFNCCDSMAAAAVVHLARCPRLKSVDGLPLTSHAAKCLAQCPELQSVRVYVSDASGAAMKHLQKVLKNTVQEQVNWYDEYSLSVWNFWTVGAEPLRGSSAWLEIFE